MTLETAAVEFLKAHVAWKSAKRATQGLPCEYEAPSERDHNGSLIVKRMDPCPEEYGPDYADEWCKNCLKREWLMAERRAALKTYNQARRRALRALKKEAP